MIWVDRSARSTVVGCRACPSARQLVADQVEAESWARDHLERCHSRAAADERRAVRASQARARRADR